MVSSTVVSSTVESCSGVACSGESCTVMLQWSHVVESCWSLAVECPVVESYSRVLQWSPAMKSPTVEFHAVEGPAV